MERWRQLAERSLPTGSSCQRRQKVKRGKKQVGREEHRGGHNGRSDSGPDR